jgi:hypothetical protein
VEQTTILAILVAAAVIGLVATLAILRRERLATERPEPESRYAVSTEGQSRCPTCGFGNLVTDDKCASCGRKLPR